VIGKTKIGEKVRGFEEEKMERECFTAGKVARENFIGKEQNAAHTQRETQMENEKKKSFFPFFVHATKENRKGEEKRKRESLFKKGEEWVKKRNHSPVKIPSSRRSRCQPFSTSPLVPSSQLYVRGTCKDTK
jgi:hypothetical protein